GCLVHLHRLRNVLQPMLAEIREPDPDLAAHVTEHRLGHQDGAWFRQGLEPGGDDDAVAVDIAALDDHVPEIDRHPEDDVPIRGNIPIGGGHGFLQLHGALHGVYGAGELDDDAVAQELDDAAAMLGHQGLKHIETAGLEGGQRAGLVALDQPAVADDVG